jgi:hypothetical protein
VNVHQLAPDEPLSPELVLVFSPELRAQALARLGPPAWPTPRRRSVDPPAPAAPELLAPPAPAVPEPLAPSLGVMLGARVLQLALVFVAVTILVLAMSIVANAMR